MAYPGKLFSLALPFLFFFLSSASTITYNVQKFGAKPDGKTDSTKAFLSAWAAACASVKSATIYVPRGRYLLGAASFWGNTCKNNAIKISIDGTLVAPSNYRTIGYAGNWLKFERVNGVTISGGTLDGQGISLWNCKASKSNCPGGATTLAFYNSNNIVISKLTSLNSQMFHVMLYGCQNAKLQGMKISASATSPNTDGIHISGSSGVTILGSNIATGDDCISIGPGASNLWIENVSCGPAASKLVLLASLSQYLEFHFQGSGVKISDVTYQQIHGTSSSQVAIAIGCSNDSPCSGIRLQDVNLRYMNQPAQASCSNVAGTSSGFVQPKGCL